ncbi:MAG: exodeoxyribonuclease VII small subunit [Candidatus Dadabacteria bacterium]|nr:exodeoxyribonuclease VII small subunit [Candidatus Dadabacteria bacterium]
MSSEMKSFENLLDEIKEIVDTLETGKLPLDESIEKFERGASLIKECYLILESVKKKISLIVEKNDGTFDLEDFSNEEQ